jgi:hypothetical protein
MKHQVRAPVSEGITKVSCLRHHGSHGARFWHRKFVLGDRGSDVFYRPKTNSELGKEIRVPSMAEIR